MAVYVEDKQSYTRYLDNPYQEPEKPLILDGEPIYFVWPLSSAFKELLLVPISDVHRGNRLFSERHLLRIIKYIYQHENCYTLLNGDLCEATTKSSLGDVYHQIGTAQDQRDWIIQALMPIKDRVLGVTMGNHEARIFRDTGMDISFDIAKALGAPYRAEGLWLKVIFGSGNKGRPYDYYIYATHGYGGARTRGAKNVKVERLATMLDADCYIMSHDHEVNAGPDVYLMPSPRTFTKRIGERDFTVGSAIAHRKMLVKLNAYIKFGDYSEAKGYRPSDLDTPIIKFAGEGKPRVKVEV